MGENSPLTNTPQTAAFMNHIPTTLIQDYM